MSTTRAAKTKAEPAFSGVAPLPHCIAYLGWHGGSEDGPASVRITVETAVAPAGAETREEAAFDLLTYLEHLLGWDEATLRPVVPVRESETVAALRLALPYVERVAATAPTEPARMARREQAVTDAALIRAAIVGAV